MRLRVQRPDHQPGVAPDPLAHQPQRLVRAGRRRHLHGVAGRRDDQVPRLELRVLDDPDDPAPDELPHRAHRDPAAVRERAGRGERHHRRRGAGRGQHPDRLRPQAGRHREGLRAAAALPVHVGPRRGLPAREPRRRGPAPPPEVRQALPRQRLRRAAGVEPRHRGPAAREGPHPGAGAAARALRGDRGHRRAARPRPGDALLPRPRDPAPDGRRRLGLRPAHPRARASTSSPTRTCPSTPTRCATPSRS